MIRTIALVLLAGFAALGCMPYRAPVPTAFERFRIIDRSTDEIWEDVIEGIAANGVLIRTIEKDSGIIYAERTGAEPYMADCGFRGFGIDNLSMDLNVFVRPTRGTSKPMTRVTVTALFRAIQHQGQQLVPIACLNRGWAEHGPGAEPPPIPQAWVDEQQRREEMKGCEPGPAGRKSRRGGGEKSRMRRSWERNDHEL